MRRPALQNAPRPNTSIVAGAAAAVAGAATLADPKGAAAKQEDKQESDRAPTGEPVTTTVPADVLDRLDAQQRADDDEAAASPAPTP